MEKKCSCCGEVKLKAEFASNKARYDGLQNNCKECNKKQRKERESYIKEYREKYYEENKDEMRLKYRDRTSRYNKEYAEKNKEKLKQKRKERYEKQKQIVSRKHQQWRELNKEYLANYKRQYAKEKSYILAANATKRRSIKLKATPSWLLPEDLEKIQLFYKIAKKLEKVHKKSYHVDHIIPLQGKDVCGLHVPWNLQVITAEENMSKGNR